VIRVILDTDPGNGIPGADIDDGLAIGLALRSPEIKVEAITVVGGNVDVDRGVECALELLEAAGAGHVPVHRGAERPLMQDPTGWRAILDTRRFDAQAQSLWRDLTTTPSALRPDPTPAAQALVEQVSARPGEITVVAVGPLTNLATAMIIDPTWAANVQRLVIMGGAFDYPNVLHELNFAYDPEATHVVLSSVAPLTILPLDVTTRTFLHLHDVDRLERAGTRLGSYLGQTSRPWVTWLAERHGHDGCSLHDPLAVASVIDPGVVRTRTASVGIELQGSLTRGRVVAWDIAGDYTLQAGLLLPTYRPVSIAAEVHNARFMQLLLDRLTS
jgi:inosine-uridine nucleoside N-ribohydrolase